MHEHLCFQGLAAFPATCCSFEPIHPDNLPSLSNAGSRPGCAALQQPGKVQAPPVPRILPGSVQSGAPRLVVLQAVTTPGWKAEHFVIIPRTSNHSQVAHGQGYICLR